MKLSRCPVCHSHLYLDALVQDDAGRELLAEVAKLPDFVAKPMVAYLGLFRPAKSDLSNTRAVKLIRQMLEEFSADHLLGSALADTVAKLREKRQNGDSRPLTNHNYLKQVYQFLAVKNGEMKVARKAGEKALQESQQAINANWYFEQAERMQRMGQNPMTSTIASKLQELGWQG